MLNLIRKNRIKNNRKSSAGFTMLEIMIIVVIIGLISAIAVPTLSGAFPRLKAKSEARAILNKMRIARSLAISEGLQVGVHYNVDRRAVFVFRDFINPLDYLYDLGESIEGPTYMLDDQVQIIDNNFQQNTLVFLPDGSASQSGALTVKAIETDAAYTISIIGATGRAKLQ